MASNATPTTDPDGQAVLKILLELDVDPEAAYNAVQGIRNMSGQNVIAKLETLEATTNVRFDALASQIQAHSSQLEAHASQLQAHGSQIQTLVSRVEALTSQVAALGSQMDWMGWALMAILGMVTALTAMGFVAVFPGMRSFVAASLARTPAEPSDRCDHNAGLGRAARVHARNERSPTLRTSISLHWTATTGSQLQVSPRESPVGA